MERINIDDKYHFSYHIVGEKNLPVILFLHGFLGSLKEFRHTMELLMNKYCCLGVDLPGHGDTLITGLDPCYTMENTTTALIKLLDFLQIDQCFLFGYSMGGRIGLYLTLNYPDRFKKVILESTSPGIQDPQERELRNHHDQTLARQLEREDFDQFLLQWYKQNLFTSLQKQANFKQLLQQRVKNNPLTLAKSLRYLGTGSQPSQWEYLHENQRAILFLVGEEDEKFIKINQKIIELCPFSHLVIIKNTGHNIHWENPREVVKNIYVFFN